MLLLLKQKSDLFYYSNSVFISSFGFFLFLSLLFIVIIVFRCNIIANKGSYYYVHIVAIRRFRNFLLVFFFSPPVRQVGISSQRSMSQLQPFKSRGATMVGAINIDREGDWWTKQRTLKGKAPAEQL